MSDTKGHRLLIADEAASLLGLGVSNIRRMTYTRELPCVNPTGRGMVRYRLSTPEKLLLMLTQPARVDGDR